MQNRWILGAAIVGLVVAVALVSSPRLQFLLGGAFVNLGFRLQDHLHAYDLEHREPGTPGQIWRELLEHNQLASTVRDWFPRSTEHPVVVVLACMDARIDTAELVGDTRRYYYIVRTAGSLLSPAEQEMMELAVAHGVRVIVLTTHSDCAAEAVAASAEKREQFPEIVALLDQRERMIQEFKSRPAIRDALDSGALEIHRARIDTDSARLIPEESGPIP
jgi:carbonic anhydrase